MNPWLQQSYALRESLLLLFCQIGIILSILMILYPYITASLKKKLLFAVSSDYHRNSWLAQMQRIGLAQMQRIAVAECLASNGTSVSKPFLPQSSVIIVEEEEGRWKEPEVLHNYKEAVFSRHSESAAHMN